MVQDKRHESSNRGGEDAGKDAEDRGSCDAAASKELQGQAAATRSWEEARKELTRSLRGGTALLTP